jgi:hypothetical protein
MANKVKLTINFEVPENVSSADVLEWVEYNIGESYHLNNHNSLRKNTFEELVDDFNASFSIVIKGKLID